MKRIQTIVIGAGQAGLAMSHCLSERGIAHVVIERGEVANSWRHERWDSLRLLTPNWQSRLPGFAYAGPDPDGFMSLPQVVRHLSDYARASRAPVEERTRVTAVTIDGGGYRVATDRGDWASRSLVIASGACNLASLPALPAFAQMAVPMGSGQPIVGERTKTQQYQRAIRRVTCTTISASRAWRRLRR